MNDTATHNTKWKEPHCFGGLPKQSGFLLAHMSPEPQIGDEVLLCLLDNTPFINEVASVKPFNVSVLGGMFHSKAGSIGWILVSVLTPNIPLGSPPQTFCSYETFIDMGNPRQMADWYQLANQTHWHFILSGAGGESVDCFEFSNSFLSPEWLDALTQSSERKPCANFLAAAQEFDRRFSMDDIFAMKCNTPPLLLAGQCIMRSNVKVYSW